MSIFLSVHMRLVLLEALWFIQFMTPHIAEKIALMPQAEGNRADKSCPRKMCACQAQSLDFDWAGSIPPELSVEGAKAPETLVSIASFLVNLRR